MKAVTYREYGGPEVLVVGEVPTPAIEPDEVLVRVRAASVNPLEWHMVRGLPYLVRLTAGLRRPKDPTLGIDGSGTVEAVGADVTTLRVGDEVVGFCDGSLAELTRAKARKLAVRPATVAAEQAAALPIAGVTALQALRDHGRVQAGERVVVNGAGGGVGSFCVQLAAQLGAVVTGVCGPDKVDLVRSLGATTVLDYTRDDFTRSATRADVVIDCVGNRSVRALRRSMTPTGRLVLIGGGGGRFLGPLAMPLRAMALSRVVRQRMVMFMAKPNGEDVAELAAMVAAGTLAPVVGRTFTLDEVAAAITYLEDGHARGKAVLTVAPVAQPASGEGASASARSTTG